MDKIWKVIISAGILCSIVSPTTFLYAATLPVGAPTAGQEDSRIKKEQRFQSNNFNGSEKGVIDYSQESSSKEVSSGVPFHLSDVQFFGNTIIPAAELKPIVQTLINHDITLADVQKTAEQVEQYYRKKGFVACYVYIPEQKIHDGILTINIVEGKLGKMNFSGNHWTSGKLLRRMFRTKDNEILTYDALRRDIIRINKHQDIQAKMILKPGEAPGTTDAQVQVKDSKPVHLSADLNNLGERNTGKYRWGTTLVDTNLLGDLDQLLLRYEAGKGAWAVLTNYIVPINHDTGTRLGLGYSRTHVDVGGDFSSLNIQSNASTYSAFMLQPVIESEHFDATLKMGLDWKSIRSEVLSTESGHDELRILNTGINVEQQDKRGKTFANNEIGFGFSGFLGASSKVDSSATRTGTGGQFFAYRGNIVRYQRITDDIIVSLASTIQATSNRLAPSEQLNLGGAYTVRGYQQGEYLSDYGGHTNAEIFFPAYIFPLTWKLPFAKESLRKQVQFVGFTDFGYGWIHHPVLGEVKSRTMIGAGAGLRIHLYDKVYARFEWGSPIGREGSSNKRNTVFYFGISMELF